MSSTFIPTRLNDLSVDVVLVPPVVLGDIMYRGASRWTNLVGNVTVTPKVLSQTGDGANSAAPSWVALGSAAYQPTSAFDASGLAAAALVSANAYTDAFTGSTNIVTLGTIATGVWSGTTIAIAKGGTGQTSANAALNALLPSQVGNAGKYFTTDATNASWAAGPAAGNLTGPITSVGLATSVASQTGTGSTFVMSAGPTVTGTLTGAAANWSGQNVFSSLDGTIMGQQAASSAAVLQLKQGDNQAQDVLNTLNVSNQKRFRIDGTGQVLIDTGAAATTIGRTLQVASGAWTGNARLGGAQGQSTYCDLLFNAGVVGAGAGLTFNTVQTNGAGAPVNTDAAYTFQSEGTTYCQIMRLGAIITTMPASPATDPIQIRDSTAAVKLSVNKDGIILSSGTTRVTGDLTNATATMSNMTGLTATLIAGRKYIGYLQVFASDSTAAEGLAFDFDGGTATATSFVAGIVGTPVGATIGTPYSTALATDLTATTATVGDIGYLIAFEIVCNAAGTFIPRFSQVTHTLGTATVRLGSHMFIQECSN